MKVNKKLKFIFVLLAALPAVLSAQKIDSTISKLKVGKMDWKFAKIRQAGKADYYYLSCTFQNMEYQAITDIGNIFISDQKAVDTLISDLSGAIKLLNEKQKARYDRKGYSISVGSLGKNVVIYDSESKFTTLMIMSAEKLIAWLRTIKFP